MRHALFRVNQSAASVSATHTALMMSAVLISSHHSWSSTALALAAYWEPFNIFRVAVDSIAFAPPHGAHVQRTCGEADGIKRTTRTRFLVCCPCTFTGLLLHRHNVRGRPVEGRHHALVPAAHPPAHPPIISRAPAPCASTRRAHTHTPTRTPACPPAHPLTITTGVRRARVG